MSSRVINILQEAIPEVEIYSIDEAFLRIKDFNNFNLEEIASGLRKKILQYTGIPTCVGIAKTKTLAKIANHNAKKHWPLGVYKIEESTIDDLLIKFPVEEIWGIARQLAKRLQRLGIYTAYELKKADPKHLRNHFSVVMEKIVYELNGISCFDMKSPQPRKNIVASRSFGQPLTKLKDIEEALATHVSTATAKARKQDSLIKTLGVFICTNRFNQTDKQYFNSLMAQVPYPTNNTGYLIKIAKSALNKIFKEGYKYKKTGVMLYELVQSNSLQQDLFSTPSPKCDAKNNKAMKLIDELNLKYGRKTIFFAAQGTHSLSKMRAEHKSKRYTTCWEELVTVK